MTEENKPSFAISGTGAVMPAGTLPMVSLGGVSTMTVTIKSFREESGLQMARVEYPDGFIKNHQTSSVEDLIGKVTNQLRGRYGVKTFAFVSIPETLAADQTINLKEVSYDD